MTTETDTTHDRMGTLFNDFLAAAEAIKQRPVLEAKVNDAEAAKAKAEAERDFHSSRLDTMRAEIDRLTSQVNDLQENLKAATFREKEVRDQRQVLLDAFRSVVKEVGETVELVEPTPNPEPEPVVSEALPAVPTTSPTSTDLGQSVPDPTQSLADVSTADGSGTYANAEVQRNTATGPFASLMDDKSQTVASAEPTPVASPSTSLGLTGADTRADVSLQPKPYSNRPHWTKPDTLSWRQWKEAGGDTPAWAYDLDKTW